MANALTGHQRYSYFLFFSLSLCKYIIISVGQQTFNLFTVVPAIRKLDEKWRQPIFLSLSLSLSLFFYSNECPMIGLQKATDSFFFFFLKELSLSVDRLLTAVITGLFSYKKIDFSYFGWYEGGFSVLISFCCPSLFVVSLLTLAR